MGGVFDQHGHSMVITANTDEVLTALKKSREQHIVKYKEAKNGFFVEAEKELQKALKKVAKKKFEHLQVSLYVPTSHEKVYDTAIRMLNLHKNSGSTTIELNSKQVDSLVHDIWDWSFDFNATVEMYSQ